MIMTASPILTCIFLLLTTTGSRGALKDLGQECDPASDKCVHTSTQPTCDAAQRKCRVMVKQSCQGSLPCVTGASCQSNQCQCMSPTYKDSEPAGTCVVGDGKPGGTCSSSDPNCPAGAHCNAGNRCACNNGYILDTSGACNAVKPENAIGGVCTAGSEPKGSCVLDVAECHGEMAVCQCPRGKTGDTCDDDVPAGTIGGACTYNAEDVKGSCTVANTECPESSSFCRCSSGYITVDGASCVPVAGSLGGACRADTANSQGECTTANSVCSGTTSGTCGCKQGYSQSGNQCKVGLNGAPCSQATDCVDSEKMTCDVTKLKCMQKAGEQCASVNECLTDASCNEVCICKAGYQQNTDKTACVKQKDAGEQCQENVGCYDFPDGAVQLTCVENKCLIQVDQSCVSNTDKCVTSAACELTTSTCKCETGYQVSASAPKLCLKEVDLSGSCSDQDLCVNKADKTVVLRCDDYKSTCLIQVGQSCKGNTDKCVVGASCDNDICKCQTEYVTKGNACSKKVTILGGTCTVLDTCTSGGSTCDEFAGKCLLLADESCKDNQDKCITGATCISSSNLCNCSASYSKADDKTCAPVPGKVGGACNAGGTCNDSNAECSTSSCICKTGYRLKPTDATCEKSVAALRVLGSSLTVVLFALMSQLL